MEVGADIKPARNADETLVIQHDWHLGLREPYSQFFIGIKCIGEERTQFFDVKITKMVDEFGFAVMPGDGTIKASEFTNISVDEHKDLHVTFRGRTTIFVAPVGEKRIEGLMSAPRSFDVATDGTYAVADSSGNLVISCASRGEVLKELKGHAMDIYRCMYFPKDVLILSGGMDMTLKLWTSDTGICAATMRGHTQAITGLGILGIGRELLSCSNDGTARMWACKNQLNIETWSFEKGKCIDMTVSVDCSRFAVICENNFLSVVDSHGDKARRDIELPSEPSSLCFSGDDAGQVVFVGFEDGHVGAYDVSQQRLIGEIVTRKGIVKCLKLFCNRLIVAFNDGGVLAYPIPSLPTTSSGVISDATINVISAEYELTGADCEPVYDMAIRDKFVYTACRDGVIRMYKLLWDM